MKTKKTTLKKLLNWVESEMRKCQEQHTIGERFVALREVRVKIKGNDNGDFSNNTN